MEPVIQVKPRYRVRPSRMTANFRGSQLGTPSISSRQPWILTAFNPQLTRLTQKASLRLLKSLKISSKSLQTKVCLEAFNSYSIQMVEVWKDIWFNLLTKYNRKGISLKWAVPWIHQITRPFSTSWSSSKVRTSSSLGLNQNTHHW